MKTELLDNARFENQSQWDLERMVFHPQRKIAQN